MHYCYYYTVIQYNMVITPKSHLLDWGMTTAARERPSSGFDILNVIRHFPVLLQHARHGDGQDAALALSAVAFLFPTHYGGPQIIAADALSTETPDSPLQQGERARGRRLQECRTSLTRP